MKRSVLIITYTYFQMMVAVQLRRTEFKEDDVDIIVTDQSKGSAQVAKRLRELSVFRSVFYVHDMDGLDKTGRLSKYRRYLFARLQPEKTLRNYVCLNERYDVFLFHNASLLTHLILRHCGKRTQCFRFEEGYSTYTRPLLEKSRLRRWMIRCAFGDIGRRVCGLYLFHPELFTQKVAYPLKRIRLLSQSDGELKHILNSMFAYAPDPQLARADYIFLEESFRTALSTTEDVELAAGIAETVGKQRFVVKQHPRSPNNPFEEKGIATAGSSDIPWEVILMNERFENKTLLTVMSGTALAPLLYDFEPVTTYLLFRCMQEVPPMLDEAYLSYIGALNGDGHLIIPQDKKNFFEILTAQIKTRKETERMYIQ